MFCNFMSASQQSGGIGRNNGRETFSYNLYLAHGYPKNTDTHADWLRTSRYCVYGSKFCLTWSDTTTSIRDKYERLRTLMEDLSNPEIWQILPKLGWGYETISRDLLYLVQNQSSWHLSRNSLPMITWHVSMICIKYCYIRFTIVHNTLTTMEQLQYKESHRSFNNTVTPRREMISNHLFDHYDHFEDTSWCLMAPAFPEQHNRTILPWWMLH